MFDEKEIPEIISDLESNKERALNELMHTYLELFMVKHEKCNHFEKEMEFIIFDNILDDLSQRYGKDIQMKFLNKLKVIRINLTKGISMLPEIEPGDIHFIRYSGDNINVGDDVIGYDCRKKTTLIHRVVEIMDRKIITKGVNNKDMDLMTVDTIFGKVILTVKRNTEFWRFLVKGLKLNDDLIECLNYSLDIIEEIDIVNDIELKEKENIKILLKDLEKNGI